VPVNHGLQNGAALGIIFRQHLSRRILGATVILVGAIGDDSDPEP
jgi:hypothetical protein